MSQAMPGSADATPPDEGDEAVEYATLRHGAPWPLDWPDVIPVGTVIAFAGPSDWSATPTGYVVCNGALAPKAKPFEELGRVLGAIYESERHPEKFHVPDYRGRFLRGADESSGRDLGLADRMHPTRKEAYAKAGSFQDEAVGPHTHTFPTGNGGVDAARASHSNTNGNRQIAWTEHNVGRETRPVNVSIHYLIRY